MSTVDDALAEELITVEIVGLPVDVQREAQQQNDELTRELVLVAEQLRQEGDSAALPVRFVEVVGTLSTLVVHILLLSSLLSSQNRIRVIGSATPPEPVASGVTPG